MLFKKVELTLFLFAIFFLSPCFLQGKDVNHQIFYGVVEKVSDGDTIWVRSDKGQKLKIRIWGIDTPEKYTSNKLDKDAKVCHSSKSKIRKLGIKASWFAKKMLYGKKVKVKAIGRGFYGRTLAKIQLPDGKDYGLIIIGDGYSCVYRKSTSRVYIKAMKEAEKNKKGLWGIDPQLMKCLCY